MAAERRRGEPVGDPGKDSADKKPTKVERIVVKHVFQKQVERRSQIGGDGFVEFWELRRILPQILVLVDLQPLNEELVQFAFESQINDGTFVSLARRSALEFAAVPPLRPYVKRHPEANPKGQTITVTPLCNRLREFRATRYTKTAVISKPSK